MPGEVVRNVARHYRYGPKNEKRHHHKKQSQNVKLNDSIDLITEQESREKGQEENGDLGIEHVHGKPNTEQFGQAPGLLCIIEQNG